MWTIKDGALQIGGSTVEQIKSPNIGGSFADKPRIVVIHFTAGSTARSSAEWFRNPRNTSSSAHVVIERDGSVLQCVSFEKVAWHAGKSRWRDIVGLNKSSIGIELANWGALRPAGDGWETSTGKRIAAPFMGVHRNGNPDGSTRAIGWEPYPEEQFEAARRLVEALMAAYGINEIVGHDDISPIRKSDPGPAFNMGRFRTCLLSPRSADGDNTGVVVCGSGLNLRTGPGTDFAAITTLKNGAIVQLLGIQGSWLQVSTVNDAGDADRTGWVFSRFVQID